MHASTPFDRRTLLAAALAVAVLLSGCSGLEGITSFTASPAGVCDGALSDTGYEPAESGWQNVSRTVEALGSSQEVAISNYFRTYRRPTGNGSTAAAFGVLATPRGSVLGQSVNPLSGLPPDRLVTELANRFVTYGEVTGVERTGRYSRTTLGSETTVTVFRVNGTAEDGEPARLTVHVTRVSHGGDLVIAGGIYGAGDGDERDRVARLLGCLTHAGTTAGGAGTATGSATTATSVELRDRDLPPGVSRAGVANATQLLSAHRANGQAVPYRVVLHPVGPALEGVERARVTRGSDRIAARVTGDGGTTTYWAAAGEGVVTRTGDGRIVHAGARTPAGDRLTTLTDRASVAVVPYVRFGTFETVGAVRTEDGRLVRLRLTGIDTTGLAAAPWTVAGSNGTVGNASGTMLVTPDGVIRRARFAVTVATEGRTETDRFRYRIGSASPDALARPDWASRAPRVRASYVNGTLLAVEPTGSAPIEAGTELAVVAEGQRLGTVAVPERVSGGEVLYLTGAWETYPTALSLSAGVGERPAPPDDPADFRAFSSLAVTGDGPNGGFQVRVVEPDSE